MKSPMWVLVALGGWVGLGCGGGTETLAGLKTPAVEVATYKGALAHVSVTISGSNSGCPALGADLHGTLDGVALTVSTVGGGGVDPLTPGVCKHAVLELDGIAGFPEGDSVLHLADASATWEIKLHHLGTERTLTQVEGFQPGKPAAVGWSDATDALDPAKLLVTVGSKVVAPVTVQGSELHFTLPGVGTGPQTLTVDGTKAVVTACPSGVDCFADKGRATLEIQVTP